MSTKENSLWEKIITPIIVAVIAGVILLYLEHRTDFFSNNPTPTLPPTPILSLASTLPPSPTEFLSPTAIPTQELIVTMPTDVITPSPIAIIEQYYRYLNNAEYDKAWAMFTPYFQQNQTAKNFDEYKNWAININRAVLTEPIVIVEQSDLAETLEIYKVTYYLKSGSETSRDNMKFYLTRSSTSAEWLINGIGLQQ